jgi:hypothetical protein
VLTAFFWGVVVWSLLWVISDMRDEFRRQDAVAAQLQAEADKRHWDAVFARIEGRVTDEEDVVGL